MPKELLKSIDLPLEMQFRENWGWEDSLQCYELDTEYQDMSYFTDMDPDDLIKLIRKMDNFLKERGLSDHFISNFSEASVAFEALNDN